MRLYLDTEFNGYRGELISIAVVDPAGPVFYEVRRPSQPIDPWVAENVMPKLLQAPISDDLLQRRFHGFMSSYLISTVYADWFEDFAHFSNLLCMPMGVQLRWQGAMQVVHTPKGLPVSALPHNARADAMALAAWHTSSFPTGAGTVGGNVRLTKMNGARKGQHGDRRDA